MNKILSFKKIVSIGFFAAFLAVFLSAGTAQAGFWDWLNLNKANNNSQQAATIANAETTYKWVNNGSVSKSDSRKTGNCSSKKQVTTYTCDSSTKGNKLYDGTGKGSSYGDIGNAWPIYEGENTSTATEYTYDGCNQDVHNTSGTVNEWECKSSDSPSSSSSFSTSTFTLTAKTGSALDITSTSANLNGTINPKGENISVYFKYRKESESSDATKTTEWVSTGSRSNDVTTSIKISNLSSGTKYVYRFYAYNHTSGKTVYGYLKSFTTFSSSPSSSSSQSSSSVSSGASSSSSSVQQYSLKVKISGAGKITSSGGSGVISCKRSVDSKGKGETSGDCNVKFNKGESVTLTPSTPSTQYEFATWAEACRGSQKLSACTIKMTGNKTVSATFNKKAETGENAVTVSVRKTGAGVGKVVSIISGGKNSGKEDGAINCGSNCSQNYKQSCESLVKNAVGEYRNCGLIYFKAVAEKGSTFSGWGGDCLTFKGVKDQCYVTLDGDKSINAKFNEGRNNTTGKNFDLTVTMPEGGVVTSADNKINCGAGNTDCEHSYGKNGTVTLKATPNSGYSFKDANISCSGNDNRDKGIRTCKVKMTKNQNVKINFKTSGTTGSSSSSSSSSSSQSMTVKIKNVGTGRGYAYVYSYKDGKNTSLKTCQLEAGATCEVEQSAGVNFRIQAKPYQSSFDSWESGCGSIQKATVSGDLCNVTVGSSGKTVNVRFTKSSGSSSSSNNSSSSISSSSSSQTTASTWKLKVTVSGNGRVQDSQSKIDCGSNMACEATYSKGQMITLKTEDTDSTGTSYNTKIDSWSGGGCSGTANACFVTMDGDKEITIKFVSK